MAQAPETNQLTASDPEPPDDSIVIDSMGRRWISNWGHYGAIGRANWLRIGAAGTTFWDPESWTKVAGNYGPVTAERLNSLIANGEA